MAINVVEIIVRAKNETEAAFAEADASSRGMSKAFLATGLIAGAALAGIGYESLKMATNFQKSMEMLVTQAGVPQARLNGLKQDVLNLASQVGFSPDSLAESLYHVASNMESLGAKSSTMMQVVKVAAEGAKVGGADLVDVTNALTAAVASGIPGVQNYSQAMGMLNATVGAGDMKMQDLAEAFGSGMVATVKGFGLSLKDVGAALATFGDNNIRGAHAGTQLRMSVMALAVPAKAGAAQLQAWGYSANQLATDMRTGGLLKALDDLHTMFIKNGVTAKEQGDVITNMFGKKAGAGLNVLMDQLDRLKSKYPAITKGATDFGSAWAKTNDTLAQKLDDLRGKFDAVMISIGDKLLPVATKLADFVLSTLIPAIGKIVSWLARHRDMVIAVGAGIAAVLIPALVAWAASAAAAAAATIAATWPLLAIIAAVALVVYAILDLAHHWKQVWGDIKAWTMDAVNFVRDSWDQMVRDIEHWADDFVNFVLSAWNRFVQGNETMISDIVHFFESLPGRILRALGNLGKLLWNAGADIIKGLIGGIESMAGAVWDKIKSIGSGISHAFSSVLHIFSPSKVFEEHGRNIVRGLVNGINGESPAALAAIRRLGGGLGMAGGGFAGGGGGAEFVLRFEPTGNALADALGQSMRLFVREKGGGGPYSAQRALGRVWPKGA